VTALAALGARTWTEAEGRAATTVLVVPVGATEQHGPHLPLSTDTDIAGAMAARLAACRPGVLVTAPVAFGASGEHAGFPGTLSIGAGVLEAVLVELGRSADHWAGVLFVSAHGGNAGAVRASVDLLLRESRRVLAWSPTAQVMARALAGRPVDAHAGLVETSLMLALEPSAVRIDRVAPGDPRPLGVLLPGLRRTGVRAESATGVLGDPTGATAALGRELLDALTVDLAGAYDRWAPEVVPAGADAHPGAAEGPRWT
jgi:mycofactocin system creatininase family protein